MLAYTKAQDAVNEFMNEVNGENHLSDHRRETLRSRLLLL